MKIVDTRDNLLDILPKKMKIAELGVFKGEFSEIILNKTQPSELFLVDIFPPEICSGDKDGNNIVYANLETYYDTLIKKYKRSKRVKVVKSTTTEFLKSIDDEYLDAVYIDADHSYDAIKNDLELSFKKVKTGGMIMGHDYTASMFPGVVKAVDEFCSSNNLKIQYLTKDGCPTYCIIKEITL